MIKDVGVEKLGLGPILSGAGGVLLSFLFFSRW
jgi:hypothetical protein